MRELTLEIIREDKEYGIGFTNCFHIVGHVRSHTIDTPYEYRELETVGGKILFPTALLLGSLA